MHIKFISKPLKLPVSLKKKNNNIITGIEEILCVIPGAFYILRRLQTN